MATQIRGQQVKLGTISRAHADAAFEAYLAQLGADVTTIYSTMSTDSERLAAIAAVTAAWGAADSDLQTTIISLVNATKTGAGLNSDGTYTLPVGENYLTGATSLAQAIGLLDAAIAQEASDRDAAVTAEASARATAVTGEASARAAAITAESATRVAAEGVISDALAAETTRATAAEADLQTQIDDEVTARTNLNTTLSTAIASEATARTNAVSSEASTRATADTTLQNNIDAEALARTTADGVHTAAIAAEVGDRIAAINSEASARATADTALSDRLDAVESAGATSALTFDRLVTRETPAGAVDGTNAVFTLAHVPHAGTEQLFLNGMLLEPGAGNDYTIAADVVTMVAAPLTGDRVKVSYFRNSLA